MRENRKRIINKNKKSETSGESKGVTDKNVTPKKMMDLYAEFKSQVNQYLQKMPTQDLKNYISKSLVHLYENDNKNVRL